LAGPEAAGAVTFQRTASDGLRLVWVTSYQEEPWLAEFTQGYQEIAGGPPDPAAALTYDAAQVLLDAVARSARVSRAPQRAVVMAALREARWHGLNGLVSFDDQGNWVDAPVHLYEATRAQRFGSTAIKGVSCKS
jgi:ABC-type branched-subunit amino acid transport system substrate-binding protein